MIRIKSVTRTLTLCGRETTKQGVTVSGERIASHVDGAPHRTQAPVEADVTRRLVGLLEQVDGS